MALLIRPEDHEWFRPQLEDSYRLRHKILVDHLGWRDLRRPDGRELDEYDHDQVYHFLSYDREGRLHGCARFTPTTSPNLTAHTFGHYAVREIPEGVHVFEISRLVIDHERYRTIKRVRVNADIMAGVFDFCQREGVTKFISFSTLDYISPFIEAGVVINPLGAPVDIEGERNVVLEVVVDDDALSKVLGLFRLPESRLLDAHNAEIEEVLANGL